MYYHLNTIYQLATTDGTIAGLIVVVLSLGLTLKFIPMIKHPTSNFPSDAHENTMLARRS